MTPEELLSELDRKVDLTKRCRFQASQRYYSLDWVTLASVVTLSLCVVGLTLIDVFDLLLPAADTLLAFLQVFSAVGVLGYSVFLSRGDFSLHQYKHHQCGLALGELHDRIASKLHNKPTFADYVSLSEEYARVLQQYENHLAVDFDVAITRSAKLREKYAVGWLLRVKVYVNAAWLTVRYIAISLLGVAAIIVLLWLYGTNPGS